MRARTSSPRLVSCVDDAFIVSGQRWARCLIASWNCAIDVVTASGCEPTSLSEINWWYV
jgi:hypothetical protein